MNEIVVVTSGNQMAMDEALAIHDEIVDRVRDVRQLLVRMELEAGWAALGFDSWEAYLEELGRVTGSSSKYLRRVGRAGLLEADTGHEVGTFREGTVRPISEILSDAKGFNAGQRAEALELAIELAGSEEELTSNVAQTAAWYVAVVNKTPGVGVDLVRRMKGGFVSPKLANELCQIMRSSAAAGVEHIVALVNDVELARTIVNLHQSSSTGWEDIADSIERTGTMPTRDGQVPIGDATNDDLIGYLNEPTRMRRFEDEVSRSELYRKIARTSAKLMVGYFGVQRDGLPEELKLDDDFFEMEKELYTLCQKAGLIYVGMKL